MDEKSEIEIVVKIKSHPDLPYILLQISNDPAVPSDAFISSEDSTDGTSEIKISVEEDPNFCVNSFGFVLAKTVISILFDNGVKIEKISLDITGQGKPFL